MLPGIFPLIYTFLAANSKNDEQNLSAIIFMPGHFVNLPLCQPVSRRLISNFLHKFHSKCHQALLLFLYFTYTSSYCKVTWHFPSHLHPFNSK